MRRALLILAGSVAVIGILTGGLAWLLTDPRPPAGATRAQRLYYAYCAQCHGEDGHGSWRASLFLLRPGDLTDPRVAAQSDRYLFDLIKHGGATIGRPGMPAFGAQLSDDDIQLLVPHVRQLSSRPREATAPTAWAAVGWRDPVDGLPLFLDPDEDDLVALLTHGKAHPVAGRESRGVERRGRASHGHHLHGAHAEHGESLVADEEQVGGRARDDLTPDLVGGRAHDGTPETCGEEREQQDEQDDEEPARAGAPAHASATAVPRE